MTTYYSNQRECKIECDTSFWKFIKTMKKQERSWQELSPTPTTWETEVWGMGTCPRGSFTQQGRRGSQARVAPLLVPPGPSRASSVLARVLDRRLPEGVEVLL